MPLSGPRTDFEQTCDAMLRCLSMTIRGERLRAGGVLVTIDGEPLGWRALLAVRRHSPAGPEWGCGGSGPSQLALAILLAVTDQTTAARFYQRFKWGVVASISSDRWGLNAGEVLRWLELSAGTDDVVRLVVET